MPSMNSAEIVIELNPAEVLADVIPLPKTDGPSFYQRRGTSLPRLGSKRAADYTRASLPTPVKPERDTVISRFKDFVRVNCPSWLPQR